MRETEQHGNVRFRGVAEYENAKFGRTGHGKQKNQSGVLYSPGDSFHGLRAGMRSHEGLQDIVWVKYPPWVPADEPRAAG